MSAVQTPDVLARILARKVEEVAERSARLPRAELSARLADAPPPPGRGAPPAPTNTPPPRPRAASPPPSKRRSPPARPR